MEQKLKVIVDSIINLDKNLGIKKVLKYLLIVLGLFLLFNFKAVVSEVIITFDEIAQAIHEKKLAKRDELVLELSPLLTELRAITGADRVIYIEYHNSKENLVGIPFKYLDLVMVTKKYGVPEFDLKKYHELSSGVLSPIFPSLRKDRYVINDGSSIPHDVSDFIHAQDGSVQQVFLNLPGVNSPIGIIVLEWLEEDPNRDWTSIVDVSRDYVTRINGLILSKSHF